MLENIRLSFRGIWSHKLRSILTMLGIIIGIAAIIAIVSTIQGTNEQIKQNLVGSGTNTVTVTLDKDGWNYEFDYEGRTDLPPLSEDLKAKISEIEVVQSASFIHSRDYAGVLCKGKELAGSSLYGVDGMARERREQFRPTRDRQLTLGIVLCVLAVIPVFLSLVLYGEGDHFGHLVAVALLLVLAGIGVLLIVRSSILWGSYQRLLEEGDYSRAGKEASRVAAPFNSIYWGLVTAGFLAWGFLGNAWDRCWMVWPVAAVAYGAIYGIVRALRH